MMTEPGFSVRSFPPLQSWPGDPVLCAACRVKPLQLHEQLGLQPQARVKRTGSNMGVEPISSVIPWAIVSIIYASSLT